MTYNPTWPTELGDRVTIQGPQFPVRYVLVSRSVEPPVLRRIDYDPELPVLISSDTFESIVRKYAPPDPAPTERPELRWPFPVGTKVRMFHGRSLNDQGPSMAPWSDYVLDDGTDTGGRPSYPPALRCVEQRFGWPYWISPAAFRDGDFAWSYLADLQEPPASKPTPPPSLADAHDAFRRAFITVPDRVTGKRMHIRAESVQSVTPDGYGSVIKAFGPTLRTHFHPRAVEELLKKAGATFSAQGEL